jgi:hypothetical protein
MKIIPAVPLRHEAEFPWERYKGINDDLRFAADYFLTAQVGQLHSLTKQPLPPVLFLASQHDPDEGVELKSHTQINELINRLTKARDDLFPKDLTNG